MIRFSFCNEMCRDMPISEVFELAARLGYHGVEIAPFTLAEDVREVSAARRAEIAQAARDAGVEIVGLHWLLVSPKGLYLNHPEKPEVRRRTIEYLQALIDFCGDLGGRIMVFGSPAQRNIPPGHSRDEVTALTVAAFRQCMPAAEARNVILCIEPLSPKETNLITSHREALELVRAVNHPNFRMMLDVKAMSSESVPVPDIIRACRGVFVHFHANDANLRGPGFGETDFVPIFRALDEAGYDGYVSVEVFDFEPDGPTIAAHSIEYMRRCAAEANIPIAPLPRRSEDGG